MVCFSFSILLLPFYSSSCLLSFFLVFFSFLFALDLFRIANTKQITRKTYSVIFNVDPDTHIDSIDQAESAVLEGTANWSAKIAVTGTKKREPILVSHFYTPSSIPFYFLLSLSLNPFTYWLAFLRCLAYFDTTRPRPI